MVQTNLFASLKTDEGRGKLYTIEPFDREKYAYKKFSLVSLFLQHPAS